MIREILESFERSFRRINTRSVLFILFIFGAIALADYLTGFSFYQRVNSRLEALEKLYELRDKGFESEEKIREIYKSTIEDIQRRDESFIEPTIPLISSLPDWLAKGIGATFAFYVFLPWSIFTWYSQGIYEALQLLGGVLIVVAICGILGIVIPTLGAVWVNFTIYSIIQIVVLFEITKYGNRIRE